MALACSFGKACLFAMCSFGNSVWVVKGGVLQSIPLGVATPTGNFIKEKRWEFRNELDTSHKEPPTLQSLLYAQNGVLTSTQ